MSKDYNIFNIVKGFTMALRAKYVKLPTKLKELSDKRIKTCSECIFLGTDVKKGNTHNRCKICGCWIPEKTFVESEKCPMDFWETGLPLEYKKK